MGIEKPLQKCSGCLREHERDARTSLGYTSVNSSEYNSSHYLCPRLANILFIDH